MVLCQSPHQQIQEHRDQGTLLGPFLFFIHINDITESLSSEIRLFVDDSISFRIIKSHEDHLMEWDMKFKVMW